MAWVQTVANDLPAGFKGLGQLCSTLLDAIRKRGATEAHVLETRTHLLVDD